MVQDRDVVTTNSNRNLHTSYSTVGIISNDVEQVTCSDLAKFQTNWSVARPLCDSWGSCIVRIL